MSKCQNLINDLSEFYWLPVKKYGLRHVLWDLWSFINFMFYDIPLWDLCIWPVIFLTSVKKNCVIFKYFICVNLFIQQFYCYKVLYVKWRTFYKLVLLVISNCFYLSNSNVLIYMYFIILLSISMQKYVKLKLGFLLNYLATWILFHKLRAFTMNSEPSTLLACIMIYLRYFV